MRALWKIPFVNPIFYKKAYYKKNIFRIKYKNNLINQYFIDKKIIFRISKKKSIKLDVTSQMVGYKIGEFILTKISHYYTHLKKSKKKTK